MTINFLPNLQNKTNYDPKKVDKTDFRRDDFAALRSRGYLTEDKVNFGGGFKFLELEKIPCAFCKEEVIMITPHEQKAVGRLAVKATGRPLQELIRTPLVKMFDTTERKMAFILIDLSKRHPGKNLNELTCILAPKAEKRLVREQAGLLRRAAKSAGRLKGDVKEQAERLFEQARSQIYHQKVDLTPKKRTLESTLEQAQETETDASKRQILEQIAELIRNRKKSIPAKQKNNDFKRGELISAFDRLYKAETDEANKQELGRIIRILSKLPKSSTSIDSFVVKYHRRSSREIAETLLRPYVATKDHAEAKSKGGPSTASNYFSAHACCNERKTNEDFEVFYAAEPHLAVSIPRNLKAIKETVERQNREQARGSFGTEGRPPVPQLQPRKTPFIRLGEMRQYLHGISLRMFDITDKALKLPYLSPPPAPPAKKKGRRNPPFLPK